MALVTCDGILLRSHPYSDSSRILRFLTPGHGVVAVIGKGVRTRSARGEGAIPTYAEGTLTFFHRPDRELHTLKEFQTRSGGLALGRDLRRFSGAALVSELLLAFKLEAADEDLFAWVRLALARLGEVPAEAVPGWILAGSWRVLALLGFPPETDHCLRCGTDLAGVDDRESGRDRTDEGRLQRFDVAAGGLICSSCAVATSFPRVGPTAREDLRAMVAGEPPPTLKGAAGHLSLLEAFALHHLGPRSGFKSFAAIRPHLNKT